MKRLIVLGDIHGNVEAMKAVVHESLSTYGEHIDGFVLLGDYCCDFLEGEECIKLINTLKEKFPIYAINGNRETGMVKPYKETKDKGDNVSWAIDSTMGAPLLACERLSNESLEFLTSLPGEMLIKFEDASPLFLQHKMPLSEETLMMLKNNGCKTVLTAHTHEPHSNDYEGLYLFNPGSVGLADTGVMGADYGVLSFKNGEWSFIQKHCDYDYEAQIERVKSNPLLMEKCKKWGEALILSVKSGLNVASLYMFQVNRIAKMYNENKNIDFNNLDLSFSDGRYANVSPTNTPLLEKVISADECGNSTYVDCMVNTDEFKPKSLKFPVEDWMYDMALESIKVYLGKRTKGEIEGDVYEGRVSKAGIR